MKNHPTNGKFLLLLFVFLVSAFPTKTSAFFPGTWSLTLSPSQYQYYEYNIEKGDGLIVRFSVQTGQNIAVFILNRTEHDIFQSGGMASAIEGVSGVQANPNSFVELSVKIPYDGNWYVYVFNQDILRPANIEIFVAEDEEGPMIESIESDRKEPYFGEVTFEIRYCDESSFYQRIEVYVDEALVYSDYNVSMFPSFVISLDVEIQTYDFTNGNHTLRVEMVDQFGHVTQYQKPINISNSWMNYPGVAQNVFWISGILALLASLVLYALGKKGLSFDSWKSPVFLIMFASSFALSSGIEGGIIPIESIVPFVDLADVTAPLFGFSIIMLSLMIDQGTAYLDSHIRPLMMKKIQVSTLDSEEQEDDVSLNLTHLCGRSDILDKVRNNLRSGMSIIFGVGTAIVIWFVNYDIQHQLSLMQLGLLISGFSLAILISVGMVMSFFPLKVEIGEHTIDESLVSDLEGPLLTKAITAMIQLKMDTINRMRYAIGIGLSVFISANLLPFTGVLILDMTHAFRGIIPLISAICALFFVMYVILRITSVLLAPILIDFSPVDAVRNFL